MAVSTLDDVLASLRRQLATDVSLGPVCTRVMLRTGVNLRSPRPDQVDDGALLTRVLATLGEMGYVV
jgi:hypothetical protein